MNRNNARVALEMFGITLDALDHIALLAGHGGTKAETALTAIKAIIGTLRDGFDGKTSPTEVDAELRVLVDALAANDAAVDSALDAKFKGR